MFGISRAPGFDHAGLTWFNAAAPLSLSDLAGRLVILDFWTFCCINCFHVLPTLRRIEETFPAEVVVIGVHSPKFEHERDPAALQAAIRRYGIRHPVVHDPHMVMWEEYCVHAWPTLVFISPDGYVIGQLAGEPHPELVVQGIADMVHQFWQRGEISPAPLSLMMDGAASPSPSASPSSPTGRLHFPGKIKPCPLADGAKGWAIADSGHNQVVLVNDEGGELERWGTGKPGFVDGTETEASFDGPEGLACSAAYIYVADTRNHAIRRIDRASGEITTLAGTGCRGDVLRHPVPAKVAVLASPWDLALVDDRLFFANAGSHQIGLLDLEEHSVRPFAGSGAESIGDGPAESATLAQPSGLALCPSGRFLFIADSETSSIRRLSLDAKPRVDTIIGSGLFDFGHTNGPLAEGSLQHPLGVAAVDGQVLVADSYNGAIRRIDLAARTISDLEPTTCSDTVCWPWGEPAGIAADGPLRLLVSDTNNHRIVEIRLDEGTSRTWMG
jgi:thiol-disulfide isomerase/thioredoxin/sugar lactone lactonase YvrE